MSKALLGTDRIWSVLELSSLGCPINAIDILLKHGRFCPVSLINVPIHQQEYQNFEELVYALCSLIIFYIYISLARVQTSKHFNLYAYSKASVPSSDLSWVRAMMDLRTTRLYPAAQPGLLLSWQKPQLAWAVCDLDVVWCHHYGIQNNFTGALLRRIYHSPSSHGYF